MQQPCSSRNPGPQCQLKKRCIVQHLECSLLSDENMIDSTVWRNQQLAFRSPINVKRSYPAKQYICTFSSSHSVSTKPILLRASVNNDSPGGFDIVPPRTPLMRLFTFVKGLPWLPSMAISPRAKMSNAMTESLSPSKPSLATLSIVCCMKYWRSIKGYTRLNVSKYEVANVTMTSLFSAGNVILDPPEFRDACVCFMLDQFEFIQEVQAMDWGSIIRHMLVWLDRYQIWLTIPINGDLCRESSIGSTLSLLLISTRNVAPSRS